METAAGGLSEGTSAVAQVGAHIAPQLYSQGVSALTNGAAAAKGAASDLGDGPFGRAFKALWRPTDRLGQSMQDHQTFHEGMVSDVDEAIDTSQNHYRQRFEAALSDSSASGKALLAAHAANIKLWSTHQDMYEKASTAAAQVLLQIKGLQGRIDSLAEAGEEEFNTAIRNRDPIAAMDVWTRYNKDAQESTSESIEKSTSAIRAANFTIPLDKTPDVPKDGKPAPKTTPSTDGSGSPEATPSTDTGTPDGSRPDGSGPPKATPSTDTGIAAASPADGSPAPKTTPSTDGPGAPTPIPTSPSLTAFPQALGGSMGRAASGSGGGSAGGGGSSLSGLGSGLNPGLGSSMPTSPASSMPSAPPASSAPSPMANAGSSFQSGLASGMGAAAPPPVAEQPIAQQAMTQQPVMGSPAAGSGPAGMPIAPHGVPDAGGGGPVQGGSGGGPVGGAPMMPPATIGGGGPLAPYSAPGAGGAPTGGSGTPTTPASAGQGSSGGAAAAGGGLAAPGPLVAGGSGSGTAMGGLGASSSEVNPDLLRAQRVLAELVRGSEASGMLPVWAVSVLRLPEGSSVVVVADNMGAGGYLPATVYLPIPARLAVYDAALPMGWAQDWWCCQKPSQILVDHFEQLRKRVAGVSISVLVTTELWAKAPVDWPGGDFVGVQHRDLLRLLSEAPKLDGGHQHRLATVDPVLAQRVTALADQGGRVSEVTAAALTNAVYGPARHGVDPQLPPLIGDAEAQVLAAVNTRTATADTWAAYDAAVADRNEKLNGALSWPETYGPLDHDGSKACQDSIRLYRNYFRMARMIELVRCWKTTPPSLAELVYCALMAGFGAEVANTVGAVEQRLRG